MSDLEKHLNDLETQIPSVSGSTFEAARLATLASGQSVLSTEQGIIYRVAPNGTRQEIKKIELPTQVPIGTKVQLR